MKRLPGATTSYLDLETGVAEVGEGAADRGVCHAERVTDQVLVVSDGFVELGEHFGEVRESLRDRALLLSDLTPRHGSALRVVWLDEGQ
ncbi:MAG: hypothetical protein P8R42_20885 [Candidatus Binatia bacterium]|nr:hypothetical protein [Candidatus Binatia bacterium]